jgi:hypothetical protein
VVRFRELFAAAPGVFKVALDGARAGAETLSGDRLQGIAEIIQNADDCDATSVSFQIVGDHLVAVHDGRSTSLSDILALATPWLSNKTSDVQATGRFGIGLLTLRAISDTLDVHSGPYHVRLGGEPPISAIGVDTLVAPLPSPKATELCVSLRSGALDLETLSDRIGRWDDSALLFCRHVERVDVLDSSGIAIRTLALYWSDDRSGAVVIAGQELPIIRRRGRTADGRSWLVHHVDARSPRGVTRAHKASGQTVPLGLALSLQPEEHGLIYAGLPVIMTQAPIRVNAQFDPVTSRSDLAPTPWNHALLPLLGDLWVEAVVDLFLDQPAAAWGAIPLSSESEEAINTSSVVGLLERVLFDRARAQLVVKAGVFIDRRSRPLSDLAVEASALEGIVTPEEVSRLAGVPAALPVAARDVTGRWRLVLDDWRSSGAPLPAPVTVDRALDLLLDPDRSPESIVHLIAAGLRAGFGDRLKTLRCVVTAGDDRILPPAQGSPHALLLASSPLAEQLGIRLSVADGFLADDDDARRVLAWLHEIGAVIDDASNIEVVRRLAAAGRAGHPLPTPLTDEQLRALRDAFEQITPEERAELGRDVGRAIAIRAFCFDHSGKYIEVVAAPNTVYVSRAIDKDMDSFAVAAARTPGLLWTERRYRDVLRSSLGRTGGLGALKFLRILGAETAPRLVEHPELTKVYHGDPRRGLAIGLPGSPPQRDLALRELGVGAARD